MHRPFIGSPLHPINLLGFEVPVPMPRSMLYCLLYESVSIKLSSHFVLVAPLNPLNGFLLYQGLIFRLRAVDSPLCLRSVTYGFFRLSSSVNTNVTY